MERQPRKASSPDDAPDTSTTTTPLTTPPPPPPSEAVITGTTPAARPLQLSRSSPLSISEPTLRFPRPTVNPQLASWISSSQPDIIMPPSSRPVNNEDSGLSESTYEFITTDDESQDGITTESLRSFGESRPDDVRSLAGSERSESGIDAESESDDEPEKEEEQEEQNEEDTHSQASSIQYTEDTLNNPSPRLASHSDVLSIDDETVHLSVESTLKAGQTSPSTANSFRLASILSGFPATPRTVSPPANTEHNQDVGGEKKRSGHVTTAEKLAESLSGRAQAAWQRVNRETVRSYTLFGVTMLLAALTLQYFQWQMAPDQARHVPEAAVPATSTVVAATTVEPDAGINLTSSTSTALQIPRAHAVASNSAVIPFSNLLPDLIHEAAKAPVCAAIVHSTNEILLKIPLSTKTTWLARDSITIDVLRDGHAVKTRFSSIDEGLVIEIPYRDAHGIICVRVITTRRPKVNETFAVDFGTTLLGKALGLADVIKAKTAETADDVVHQAVSTGNSIANGVRDTSGWLGSEVNRLTDYLKTKAPNETAMVTEQWKQVQHGVRNARNQFQDCADLMQLNVLRAQITSRLWWLKMQFKTEEHAEYRSKAEAHLAKQYAKLKRAMLERRLSDETTACEPTTRFWGRTKCRTAGPPA